MATIVMPLQTATTMAKARFLVTMPEDLSLLKPPLKAPMLVPRMRSSITTTSAWFLTTKNLTAETGPLVYWGCWMTFKIGECRLMAKVIQHPQYPGGPVSAVKFFVVRNQAEVVVIELRIRGTSMGAFKGGFNKLRSSGMVTKNRAFAIVVAVCNGITIVAIVFEGFVHHIPANDCAGVLGVIVVCYGSRVLVHQV